MIGGFDLAFERAMDAAWAKHLRVCGYVIVDLLGERP
jgi:hypothetical protein